MTIAITTSLRENDDLLKRARIIGEKLSGLAQVKSLNNGILVIKVNSSSLNQLLSTTEKPKILLKLKTQYPFLRIKNVVFKTS